MTTPNSYGYTTEELAQARDNALRCTTCGMLATVDPWFHQERYGHAPSIYTDGQTLTFRSDGRWVNLWRAVITRR